MQPIPWSFINSIANLSWRDVAWGYQNGYLNATKVIEFAWDRLSNGEESADIIELAGILPSEEEALRNLLFKVAGSAANKESQKQWLILVLSWLYENQTSMSDTLDEIVSIYADFDYPEELVPFVRYMPTTDGWDPTVHSLEENLARMIAKWSAYLLKETGGIFPKHH